MCCLSKIYSYYMTMSKRKRDSITIALSFVGLISTVCTIIGFSLAEYDVLNVWLRLAVVILVTILLYILVYMIIGLVFKERIELVINNTPVEVTCGDIFSAKGYKVIGCDTHFHTTVDDIIISKKSLHGKLVLEHGNVEKIKVTVQKESERLKLNADEDGLYNFPLGTIIRYDSSVDQQTYLMLAMTELNTDYEAHTNMAKYEQMLMKMWNEISRVYASHDIVLPILGDGITRFDDRPKDKYTLLRCMLCTFNASGKSFNSKVKIVIYGDTDNIPLYELKDIVSTIGR